MGEEWVEYDGGAVQEWHRSARHIRVASGVTVIPEDAFLECEELRAVDLSNVVTISNFAFDFCRSLEQISWTSAPAVEIGEAAFASCRSLREIDLSNVTKIGERAFTYCNALERVAIPPSVRTIGTRAFNNCQSLERITIPSSVTLIDESAFGKCTSLVEVTLCEGVQCIAGDAFYDCNTLARINIPPVAFVIDIGRSNCHFMRTGKLHSLMRTTMPRTLVGRKLIVSKWLQYRSPSQLAQAGGKVNEILRRQTEEGQKIALIREWFAYFDRLDVTTMIELAIWRVNLDGNERDDQARQARRQNCGGDMNVIIPGTLEFLE